MKLLLRLIAIGFIGGLSSLASIVAGQQLTPRLFSTNELIARLDSPRFEERAEATAELVRMGESSLRPLARSFLSASSEQAWRIRQIIRQIAVQGDEATFFKAAALMQALYGSQIADADVLDLQRQWIAAKSDRARSDLIKLGAEITFANDENEAQALDALLFMGTQMEESVEAAAIGPVPTQPAKSAVRDQAELESRVDTILLASVDANRQLALGSVSNSGESASAAVDTSNEALIERAFIQQRGRRMVVVQGNRLVVDGFGGYFYPESANRVKFGAGWKGSDSDFANVVAIKGVNSIELESLTLSLSQLQAISRVPGLQHVKLDRCQLAADAGSGFAALSQVQNLTFANQTLTPEMVEALKEFKELRSLRLESTNYDPAAFWPALLASPGIYLIELKSQTLTNVDLDYLGQFNGLQSLVLMWSKFPMAEYKQFLLDHPTLRAQVVNKAFLGVRGGSTFDEQDTGPCVISEVIVDSAAEKGGVQVLDVVESVNGQKVETFRELVMYISNYGPGEKIKLTVKREGQPLELEITLAERPPNAQ